MNNKRSLQELNEYVKKEVVIVRPILQRASQIVVGQERLLNRMVVSLLCGGHLLIEGVPGLAKTLAVKTLASTIRASFQRVQFTPDLLPADLTGTMVYNPKTGDFTAKKGVIFTHFLLADEINRAPAKVQSALLEAMEEKQITLGEVTFRLDEPFMVLATQNPIEQEGTYPLPEAQLDRFMFKVIVGYPSRDEERIIVERMSGEPITYPDPILAPDAILKARRVVNEIYVDDKIIEYVLNIITATRKPQELGIKKLDALIEFGASPRATIALIRASKALAFLSGRGYVIPEDIKLLATDVLRHRLLLSFEAQSENITPAQIVQQLLKQIEVP